MYPHYNLTNLWRPSLQFIQVGACEVAAVYLRKLQVSHSQLLEALAQRAAQDSAAAEAQATEASTAIETARMALAQRKVALATAQQDADAQVCGGWGVQVTAAAGDAASHAGCTHCLISVLLTDAGLWSQVHKATAPAAQRRSALAAQHEALRQEVEALKAQVSVELLEV
jgi:L,D-peptidoglycan transpeptidase YkuD (ErfK/YbiS/YcfS/YnhG family)